MNDTDHAPLLLYGLGSAMALTLLLAFYAVVKNEVQQAEQVRRGDIVPPAATLVLPPEAQGVR